MEKKIRAYFIVNRFIFLLLAHLIKVANNVMLACFPLQFANNSNLGCGMRPLGLATVVEMERVVCGESYLRERVMNRTLNRSQNLLIRI